MGQKRLVLGAGMIGSEVARQFAAAGDEVVVVSRRGTAVDGATARVADAADAAAVTIAADGAATIVVCINPPYPDWVRDWPPVIEAVISAAAATGADVVLMGNLYGYGPVTAPMTEDTPLLSTERKGRLRAALWKRLADSSAEKGFRSTEVRASDYFGPGAGPTSHLGDRFFRPVLASKRAWVVGDPAVSRSWAYLPDIAATLRAAAAYTGDWGRPWLVPHAPARSVNDLVSSINEEAGVHGSASGIPSAVFAAGQLFSPFLREVAAMRYQFVHDFVVDSAVTEGELGVTATLWSVSLPATTASYR